MAAPADKAQQQQQQQQSQSNDQPPLWFPLPNPNGNWRNKERDAKARAETTKHIGRLIESGEANVSQKLPIEYRHRLSKVVPYLEDCLYREAPDLKYYQDVSTLCEELQQLFAQITRQFNNCDRIERMMQDFEERTGIPLNEAQRDRRIGSRQ